MNNLPWPELFVRIRPHLELKGSGQPDRDGWVTARCIDAANHKNGDQHHSLRINVTTGGVRCMSQNCPVGPNMNTLAGWVGVDGKPTAAGPDPLQSLAEERLLPLAALRDKYGISIAKGGWAFAVDDPDAKGQPHMKRDPIRWADEGAPKNWWPKNSGVVAKDLVYGLSHVPQGTETIYGAAGEIDCITLLEAGYKAVSFLAGEAATPSAKAIQKLVDHGVRAICLVYDKDEAGEKGAPATAEVCIREGLDVSLRALPEDLGEGGDINDLWRRCDGDREAFIEALEACPVSPHDSSSASSSLGSESGRRILQTFLEFLEAAQEAENAEYLVDGLFPSDWLLGFAGKPRVGKSLLALDLGRCVATGQPFLGRETKQGPIVYVALEDPASLVKDRIQALGELPCAYIYIGPWSDSTFEALGQEIREIRPALIIIDPLASTYGNTVKDESDNAALAAHMARLYSLGQEVGASVLCIHHQRKATGPVEDTIRGGSAILAATHCMVVATGSPERLKLTFLTKTMPIESMTLTLGNGLSWSVAEQEARAVSSEDTVIFALHEMRKATAAALTEFLGIERGAVNTYLTSLKSKGRIVVVGKQGRAPIYGEKSTREQQSPLSDMAPGGVHQDSGGVD